MVEKNECPSVFVASLEKENFERYKEAIKKLLIDEWKDEYPEGHDFDVHMNKMEQQIKNGELHCLVAFGANGELMGVLMSEPSDSMKETKYQKICEHIHVDPKEVLHISTALVDKKYRGMGIASELYPHLDTFGYKALSIRTLGEKQSNFYSQHEDTDGSLRNLTGYTKVPTPEEEKNPNAWFGIKIIKNPEIANDSVRNVINKESLSEGRILLLTEIIKKIFIILETLEDKDSIDFANAKILHLTGIIQKMMVNESTDTINLINHYLKSANIEAILEQSPKDPEIFENIKKEDLENLMEEINP